MSKLPTAERSASPAREFAFPTTHKLPLEDAAHVRNAAARFDRVDGVSDAQRDAAWQRIEAAAVRFGVELGESNWRELERWR
ncbi:MAG: DUF6582 domain-containing protein [Burkholderiaceae bacterium]